MKNSTFPRSLSKMSRAELDTMAAEFDREFVADTFGPMSPEMRRRWRRAQRKGTRQERTAAKAISVTLEAALLRRVDRIAKRCHLTRASLIARGLEEILAREEVASRSRAKAV